MTTSSLLDKVKEAAVFDEVRARVRFRDGVWTKTEKVEAKNLSVEFIIEHTASTDIVEIVGGPLDGRRYNLRGIHVIAGDTLHVTIPQLLEG